MAVCYLILCRYKQTCRSIQLKAQLHENAWDTIRKFSRVQIFSLISTTYSKASIMSKNVGILIGRGNWCLIIFTDSRYTTLEIANIRWKKLNIM